MPDITARRLAAENILDRSILHRAAHISLTIPMYWMWYIFTDDQSSFNIADVHNYDFMRRIATEPEWGYGALAIAVIGTLTAFSTRWKTRAFGAAVLAFGHAVLSISFALGKSHAPSVGLFLSFAFLGASFTYSTGYIGKRFTERLEVTNSSG